MAAADVMKFGNASVFHVFELAAVAVQMADGEHRAFGCRNKRPDLCDQCVKLSRVLRQARANDRQVVEVDVLATQRPDHVVHPLQDDLLIERPEVIKQFEHS